MIPKPTATKKDAKTRTPTSRGNSASGFENLFFTVNPHRLVESLKNTCKLGK
jgi:hypothetical protein